MASEAVSVTEVGADGAFLQEPWRALVAAARAQTAPAIRDEYEALFVSVGRPEVHLYGSHYLCGFLNDKPLAVLESVGGDKARAAQLLGVSRRTLERRVAEWAAQGGAGT